MPKPASRRSRSARGSPRWASAPGTRWRSSPRVQTHGSSPNWDSSTPGRSACRSRSSSGVERPALPPAPRRGQALFVSKYQLPKIRRIRHGNSGVSTSSSSDTCPRTGRNGLRDPQAARTRLSGQTPRRVHGNRAGDPQRRLRHDHHTSGTTADPKGLRSRTATTRPTSSSRSRASTSVALPHAHHPAARPLLFRRLLSYPIACGTSVATVRIAGKHTMETLKNIRRTSAVQPHSCCPCRRWPRTSARTSGARYAPGAVSRAALPLAPRPILQSGRIRRGRGWRFRFGSVSTRDALLCTKVRTRRSAAAWISSSAGRPARYRAPALLPTPSASRCVRYGYSRATPVISTNSWKNTTGTASVRRARSSSLDLKIPDEGRTSAGGTKERSSSAGTSWRDLWKNPRAGAGTVRDG